MTARIRSVPFETAHATRTDRARQCILAADTLDA